MIIEVGYSIYGRKGWSPSFFRWCWNFGNCKAISFALDLGLTSIIVEGDSKVIVKTLKCEDASFATFGHLISSTKFSMDAFNSISFSHTRRLYNSITHNLARYTRYVNRYSSALSWCTL